MVSHPETGSDSPIGSDRDRGRDSTTLVMSCFEYQCFIPRKSCICALISRIPLSNTEMYYLKARVVTWG